MPVLSIIANQLWISSPLILLANNISDDLLMQKGSEFGGPLA